MSAEGVTLSLNGSPIANDSYVDVDDIGGDNEGALLCQTDKTGCCTNPQVGEWYFPDMTSVKSYSLSRVHGENFFYRNRNDRVVRLIRHGAPSERGLFYCQLPNANNIVQTIYVNIGKLMSSTHFKVCHGLVTMFSWFLVDLHIHSSTSCPSQTCTRTIAEIGFSVTCSVRGAPTNTDVLEWLFAGSILPDDIMTMPQTETSGNINIYNSTLLFPPLQLSHAGVCTCRVRGHERLAEQLVINIKGVFKMSTESD